MNDDLISRQAATQTALEFIVEYLGGAFYEHFQKKMIERMYALPSAQPEVTEEAVKDYCRKRCLTILTNDCFYKLTSAEPDWIPVTERLPKKAGNYLVTDHNGDIARYIYLDTESSKDYWMRCVKAWMRLPTPWEGGQE